MSKIKRVGLALMAVFAFTAVGVASAYAAHEPVWRVKTKVLSLATETAPVTGSGKSTNQTLFTKTALGNIRITCKNVSVVGTNHEIVGGSPGASKETLEYTTCAVSEATGCELSGKATTIKTNALMDTLAWKAATGNETLTIFSPEGSKIFVKLTLEKCSNSFFNKEANAEGEVIFENTGPKFGEEAIIGVIKSSGKATGCEPAGNAVTEYFTGETGKRVKHAIAKLSFFGGESEYCGEANIKLVSEESWGITEG